MDLPKEVTSFKKHILHSQGLTLYLLNKIRLSANSSGKLIGVKWNPKYYF